MNDGGPAFPSRTMTLEFGKHSDPSDEYPKIDSVPFSGMSIRDWFAGQYIAGNPWRNGTSTEFANEAYRLADAMIAERSK